MKRQPTKSFPILLLLLFFIASSCERADDHEGHSHEGKLVFETVNLDQIPQFEKKFRSDSAIYKSKIPFNKSGNDTITYFDLIVPENINSQLYDEAANLHYYTFALNLKEHNRLTNLVVKETLEGNKYYVFIFKSKSIDAWIQSLAHYGSDVNFNIETEILEIELGDSYTVKSTTRPCWTSATSWICPYNAHTIGVGDWLECSTFNEGGGGLSRWRSIVNYIQVPCDNGAGGTGGSGSGGSGSGSGGSSGGGGSSSGSTTPPISVQPNAPSQLFLFASNLSPEQKTWWSTNSLNKIPIVAFLADNNHSNESEDFAEDIIDALNFTEFENEAEKLEVIKVLIYAQQNNYFNQNLDSTFFTTITSYSSLDSNDPLLIMNMARMFLVHCATLKQENPDWSDAKILVQAYLDTCHFIADLAGLVPVIGEVADLANGTVYLIEGDGVNATLSYASAIPFAGWFSAGVKFAKRTDGLKFLVLGTENLITFGAANSKKFRAACGIAVGDATKQAHHIIPRGSQILKHPVVQRAAQANVNEGFHIDQALNGIAVATWRNQPNHNQYNNKIITKLNNFLNTNPNATSQQCYSELIDIIQDAKQAIINNPNVHLNNLNF